MTVPTWENIPTVEALAGPGTDPTGLTSAEAESRFAAHGPNLLQAAPRRPLILRIAAHVTHLMAVLLWAGAVAAVIAGLPQLAVAIALVNVVNGAFSFWQEHKAERATDALTRMLPAAVTVVRDGRTVRVSAERLVPGDLVLLEEGDTVSADARIIESSALRIDQSTLTGETTPVAKSGAPMAAAATSRADATDMVFAGTAVTSGRARVVVTATGMDTEFGRIASLTQAVTAARSPLQIELGRVSTVVSIIAVTIGAALAGSAVAFGAMDAEHGVVFGLGMIVAFVPEGMLPTVTLSLALATQRMAERHALVKRLSAVETLGCTTVICTDKTGTLTRNEMTVTDVVIPAGRARLDRTITVEPPTAAVHDAVLDVLRVGLLASDARVTDDGTLVGDPTDAAVEAAAVAVGLSIDEVRRRHPRLGELPFDPLRRRVTTLDKSDGSTFLHTKGAAGDLVPLCTSILVDGVDRPLDDDGRRAIDAEVDRLSRTGLRVLAVAYRRIDGPATVDLATVESDLTYLGLVAMMDPPRPGAADAVRRCHAAGMRTIMVTGDHGGTATSIARQVSMVPEDDEPLVVTGADVDTLDDAVLGHLLESTGDDTVLFVRSTPEHKLRVVVALQAQGHVVAVTGDGVNDAPALKRADIGVAMGENGTDVAREAADVILLDDSFASIVQAVEEGRAVYANIRRFTTYIFTSNAAEALPFMLYALSGGRFPLALGVMAVLCIDLGTDLVPAIGLGAEPPEPRLMQQPPRRRTDHILTRALLVEAFVVLGGVQAIATIGAFVTWYWTHGHAGQWLDLPGEGRLYEQAVSIALATVVATQIGNVLARRARPPRGQRHPPNQLIRIGIAVEIVLVAVIVYAPGVHDVIGTAPVPPLAMLAVACMAPLLWFVDRARSAIGSALAHRD